jgi:hypothetical protein
LLLQDRHARGRQLHTQIAARHHDPVGDRQDFLEAFHGRRFFDLGNQPRTGAGCQGRPAGRL